MGLITLLAAAVMWIGEEMPFPFTIKYPTRLRGIIVYLLRWLAPSGLHTPIKTTVMLSHLNARRGNKEQMSLK